MFICWTSFLENWNKILLCSFSAFFSRPSLRSSGHWQKIRQYMNMTIFTMTYSRRKQKLGPTRLWKKGKKRSIPENEYDVFLCLFTLGVGRTRNGRGEEGCRVSEGRQRPYPERTKGQYGICYIIFRIRFLWYVEPWSLVLFDNQEAMQWVNDRDGIWPKTQIQL